MKHTFRGAQWLAAFVAAGALGACGATGADDDKHGIPAAADGGGDTAAPKTPVEGGDTAPPKTPAEGSGGLGDTEGGGGLGGTEAESEYNFNITNNSYSTVTIEQQPTDKRRCFLDIFGSTEMTTVAPGDNTSFSFKRYMGDQSEWHYFEQFLEKTLFYAYDYATDIVTEACLFCGIALTAVRSQFPKEPGEAPSTFDFSPGNQDCNDALAMWNNIYIHNDLHGPWNQYLVYGQIDRVKSIDSGFFSVIKSLFTGDPRHFETSQVIHPNGSWQPCKDGHCTENLVITDKFTTQVDSDVFVAFVSQDDAAEIARYGAEIGVGSYFVWTLDGDTNPEAPESLIKALVANKSDNDPDQQVNAYWANWSVYDKAIPAGVGKIRELDGAYRSVYNRAHARNEPEVVANQQLIDTLENIDVLYYTFMEVITDGGSADKGKLYFTDPWADLTKHSAICAVDPVMCNYANTKKGKPAYNKGGAFMGNFDAFISLPEKVPHLDLAVSIGGFAHNDTFESLFDDATARSNFVDSIVALVDTYGEDGLIGFDFDYERVNMTQAQSQSFLELVKEVSTALSKVDDQLAARDAFVNVTVLANPALLSGTQTQNGCPTKDLPCGFKSGVLQELATHVNQIQLETYDFNGAFNYGSTNPYTGFNTNIYPVDGSDFSIQAAVKAVTDAGVETKKIGLGVAAYGRALTGISCDSNGGIGAPITAANTVPQGNLDAVTCNGAIPQPGSGACSGTFSYEFIVQSVEGLVQGAGAEVFGHTFPPETQHGKHNGTTACLKHWDPYFTYTRYELPGGGGSGGGGSGGGGGTSSSVCKTFTVPHNNHCGNIATMIGGPGYCGHKGQDIRYIGRCDGTCETVNSTCQYKSGWVGIPSDPPVGAQYCYRCTDS